MKSVRISMNTKQISDKLVVVQSYIFQYKCHFFTERVWLEKAYALFCTAFIDEGATTI